jgi:hypothetical protein
VLAFLAPGLWQKRSFAKGVGDGIYELTINVPQSGVYLFFIASNSQKVTFRELPYLTLQAAQSATSGTAPAKGQQP